MSADDYIARLRANPKNRKIFEAGTIRLTPKSLEEQIRLAFQAGQLDTMSRPQSAFERLFGK